MPTHTLTGQKLMGIEVTVQDGRETADNDEVPPSSAFTRWANLAAAKLSGESQLTIRVVDPIESQRLNLQYRGKDKPTNVLSFAYDDDEMLSEVMSDHLLGDLVICADIVRQEAADKQCPVNNHWAHLTVHGVLHLLGYNHETQQQAKEMEALEISLLASININNPYETTHKLQ